MTTGDPRRLLDDEGVGGARRALLESASGGGPSDEALEAVWGALGAKLSAIPAASAPGAAPPPAPVAGFAMPAWIPALAAGAATTLALASVPFLRAPEPALSEGARGASVAAAVAGAPAAPIESAPAPAVEEAAREPAAAPAPGPVAPARPVRAPAGIDLHAETAVVLGARSALRSGDCAAALALLDDARKRIGAGRLLEEREALSVEALTCAGRDDEARARAGAFLAAYPTSLHGAAMRRIADAPAPAP